MSSMTKTMKVSGSQIFWMITSMEIGMTLLLTISPAVQDAKQDAWISMAIGGLAGILITYLVVKVSLLYPDQTLIEFSQTILGKWIGRIIVIPYFVTWYSVLGVIIREASDYLHLALFYQTPLWVLMFGLLFVIVYMTYGGIETIGRCSEIFGPIILATLLIVAVLSVSNFEWKRILPIYADSGLYGILKGSLPVTSFFGESMMLLMLVPFVSKPGKVLKRAVSGVAVASVFVFAMTLGVILTFGNLAAEMWYPFNRMIRFISIMEFIQNVDALIVILWLLSIFIKLSMLLFLTSYGTAEWLGIKSWRSLIWVVAGATFAIAVLFPDVDASTVNYPVKFWIPYVLPIDMIAIPLLIWFVGVLRKKQKTKSGNSSPSS
jgi:spore germination protein KB